MLRTISWAVLSIALLPASLLAADCCPKCGSTNAVGNQVAAVCPDCGQATVLGVSIPLASVVGAILAATVTGVTYLAVRRVESETRTTSRFSPREV